MFAVMLACCAKCVSTETSTVQVKVTNACLSLMKVIDVSFLKMYRETIIVITIPIKFKGSILSWEIGALNRALVKLIITFIMLSPWILYDLIINFINK